MLEVFEYSLITEVPLCFDSKTDCHIILFLEQDPMWPKPAHREDIHQTDKDDDQFN